MKRLGFFLTWILIAAAVAAQQPSRPTTGTISRALGLFAFPAKDQSAETQQKDESTCYGWARENTSFDPLAASTAAPPSGGQEVPRGAALKGAAGGAAIGATAGAIAGDAGQGAGAGAAAGAIRGRMAERKAERRAMQAQAQAQQQQATSVEGFRRAFCACMTGKGYSMQEAPRSTATQPRRAGQEM